MCTDTMNKQANLYTTITIPTKGATSEGMNTSSQNPRDEVVTSSDSKSLTTAEKKNNIRTVTDIKAQDPFLYYSNDTIRMKTLKLEQVTNKDHDVVSRQDQQHPVKRKTRHSFELHPSLLLDDLLTDLDSNDDDDEDMDFMALLDDVDMDFMALLEMLQQ